MRTFDTNVVVRLILGDDPGQSALAVQRWSEALSSGGVFLPNVVLAETVWVLRVSAGLDRERIAAELRRITGMQGVVVEQPAVVGRAIKTVLYQREPSSSTTASSVRSGSSR